MCLIFNIFFQDIIFKLKDLLGADHLSWLEFILKAVKHNTATIQGLLIQYGMANLELTGSDDNAEKCVDEDDPLSS